VQTYGVGPASVNFTLVDETFLFDKQEMFSLNLRPGLMQGGWLESKSISSEVDSIIISTSNPIGIHYLIVSSPDLSFRVDIEAEIDSERTVECLPLFSVVAFKPHV